MRWGLALGVLGAGLAAGPVLAADMARPAPAVVPAPVFSWTGFYIGANAGYGWGAGRDAAGRSGSSPQGWFGGGQLGYNYQFAGNGVAGIEADLQGGGIAAGAGGLSRTLDLFGTVRWRLGYAAGRVMPYVTGGVAWGDTSIDRLGLGQTRIHVGWTAGAGVEYALTDHWTAKTEYLYTDLGSKTYETIGLDAGMSAHTARIGINYKF